MQIRSAFTDLVTYSVSVHLTDRFPLSQLRTIFMKSFKSLKFLKRTYVEGLLIGPSVKEIRIHALTYVILCYDYIINSFAQSFPNLLIVLYAFS